ncbi:MAG: hypothetical protein IJ279_08075 [Clostridia bacterium]|nr:hypothetical protein [Clostridia bacterium]
MKIVDRIVCALLSFGVILAAFFAPLIHWLYQITVYGIANGILGGVTGEYIGNANDQGWTEDDYSLYNIYKLLKDFGVDFKELFSGNKELNPNLEVFEPLIKPVLIFFAITLVIALATGIVSLASKAKTPRMILSGAGIVSLIFLKSSFDKLVLPIVEGKVTLGSLLDIPWLGMITKVEVVNLSGGWVMMIMLFAAVILWNVSYLLTSDEKNKAIVKKGK